MIPDLVSSQLPHTECIELVVALLSLFWATVNRLSAYYHHHHIYINQRFNKGCRVAKSPFLAKSVQISLNKKIKTDFFKKKKQPFKRFFESPIAQKRFIFEHSYVSYGKRQKSCTFIVI